MKASILFKTLLTGVIILGGTTVVSAQSGSSQTDSTLAPVDPEEDRIFTAVEQQPQFPGGDKEMLKFLAKTIRYPENSKDNGVMGTVYLTYVVTKAGKVEDVKVARGVAADLDAEAVRVVKLMPDWSPGKMNGKPVNVLYNHPIRFVLK